MSLWGGTSSKSLLTDGQENVLNMFSNKLQSEFGKAGPSYGGELVPGANQLQNQAFGGFANIMNQGADTSGAIQQLLSGAGDPQAVRDYYNESVLAPSQQGFQNLMGQVGNRYGDTYGQTGALPQAMGNATNNFQTNLSGILGQLVFDDRNAARDRLGTGVQASLAADQGYANNLGAMLGAGNEQRGIDAQLNQGALANWESQQAYNNPWVTQLTGPVLGTQAKALGQEQGLFGQIAGGLGGLAQAGTGLASMFG